MKIYLYPNTVGRYGGKLNGNLEYLDSYIQIELEKSGFQSSFNKFELTLSYPPMYILPGIVGMETTFNNYYETLPYSRLNRKYKTINIVLKAPEFSEHFDKEKQNKYVDKFEIDKQFKNINEVELAKIVIDKFSEAGEIINTKLKKDDVFNYEIFKKLLYKIREEISSDLLLKINSIQEEEVNNSTLQRALKLREDRKLVNKPKNKLIKDLRVYYKDLPNKALYPYDFIYTEIFLNLLIEENLMCPVYHHLYIQVAKTMNEALKNSFSEDWFMYGLVVFDFEKFKTLTEKQKENKSFEIILSGLKDIAIIDKLDIDTIDRVANKIKEKGLDTELLFKTLENSKYILNITYFSRSIEEQCPIFFNLTDKTSNINKRKQIGKAQTNKIHLWLQKVTLTNKQIKIKSSDSIRGQVWLKGKEASLEFDIAELMK